MQSNPSEGMTRRQKLVDILSIESRTFEGLLDEFGVHRDVLEADLRSLQKSLKHNRLRLVADPAECGGCGFVFRDREVRHFHPPGKCPRCKSTNIQAGRLRIK